MCDAGGPNQRVDTIGNLGLWTRLGIPTRATRLKTHQMVRFCFPPPHIRNIFSPHQYEPIAGINVERFKLTD